jgi:hypothetical protein
VLEDYVEEPDYFTKYFLADYIGGNIIPHDNPASEIKESSHYGMDIMRLTIERGFGVSLFAAYSAVPSSTRACGAGVASSFAVSFPSRAGRSRGLGSEERC